jgi:hypothetical protein
MIDNKNFFMEHGYCVIKNAISDELRDFVTQYALFDEMQNFSSIDSQVPNAHSKYSDPAMESMLLQLHSVMEQSTGLNLYPTYSYYRVYRNGDELVPHKDRPSCEISATMCFNYSYTDQNLNWPIFMEGNKVTLMPGDLVIYRGCDLEHWREPLIHSSDVWHVQGFFHYVDANGPYSEFKYDKRSSIGYVDRSKKILNVAPKSYITNTD